MRLPHRYSTAVLTGLFFTAFLAGCDSASDEGTPPGAVSEGEAAALDEAAKMLDAQRLPEGALPDVESPDVDPPAEPANGSQTTEQAMDPQG